MIRIDKEWLKHGNNFVGMVCCLQLTYGYTNLKLLKSQLGLGDTLIRIEIERCLELGLLVKDKYNNYKILEHEYEKYISISEEDFKTVWERCPKCLLYFCCLMESRYGDKLPVVDEAYKVGFMPRSYFANIIGVSEKTISGYNAQLQKVGVVYFRKENHKTLVYGRVCDKTLVDKYAKYRFELDKIHNL